MTRQCELDLIISDVHMPGASGFDFIRAVKTGPKRSRIPFVFISSAVWRDKDQVDGLALGAQKFIIHPIEPQELLREVEACLSS